MKNQNTDTQHQVFVYGTLRPTGGNYEWLLKGHTAEEEVITIDGYDMHGDTKSGFPFALKGNGTILGTLITVKPKEYDRIMRGLDNLEGYRGAGNKANLYERNLIEVTNNQGEKVKAWMYVAEGHIADLVRHRHSRVHHGDWLRTGI